MPATMCKMTTAHHFTPRTTEARLVSHVLFTHIYYFNTYSAHSTIVGRMVGWRAHSRLERDSHNLVPVTNVHISLSSQWYVLEINLFIQAPLFFFTRHRRRLRLLPQNWKPPHSTSNIRPLKIQFVSRLAYQTPPPPLPSPLLTLAHKVWSTECRARNTNR